MLPSTIDRIKKECHSVGPKEAVASVSSAAGGVLDVTGPGAIPRGEYQITDYKRHTSAVTMLPGLRSESNELYLESSYGRF